MRKLKLLLAACALFVGAGTSWAQPTASTPVVGNTYYLYNPTTKLFMTTNVNLPFVRPTGSAWKLENGAQDGYITLRLKDNTTDGCGYFWGKWWANDPAANSSGYSGEREYKLVNTSGANYKLQSYAWGADNGFIYINNGTEGDRSYRLACNSHQQGGLDEGYTTWQFISEADYETYMADDYTSRIANNDFLNGLTNWTVEASKGNRQAHGNTAVEYWNESAAEGGFDYYQNLTGLPAGKYVLRAAMYNSTNGEGGANFDAAGQCGVYGTSNGETKSALVTVDGTAYNLYTTDGILVSDGNLRLGVKNTTTMTARWFGVDWIQLTCVEYCLSAVATDIPAATATTLTADKWYKFTAASSDNYTFATSAIGNITYTTTNSLLSEATGTAATATMALTEGTTYYIKSSTEQTLTISPQTFTYTVGSATADINFIQTGNTVTVVYANMTTDDPSPSIAKDFSGVTFAGNSISCVATANGFTFTVPTVTANTEYTLNIPANAIGYTNGEGTYNAAQNIVLKTPVLLDGNYYFRVASTFDGTNAGTSAAVGKYLSRGGSYGTHTTIDNYGQAITVTTDGNNATSLKIMDSQAFIYHAGSWESWADAASAGANTAHTIMLADGVYRISSNQNTGKYFKYNNNAVNNELIPVYDDGTGNNSGPIINWAVETISEHATAMQAKKDNQAATAAAAAYASGNYASLNGITTVSALESELTANYIKGDFVSPSEITSVQESFQPRAGNGATEPVTVYSNTINITEPGFYKFSMQAFFRSSDNAKLQATHAAGADMPSAALFFGDNETQIKSVYDESSATKLIEDESSWEYLKYNDAYYPNSTGTSLVAFKADMYHNDVWFYASAAGTYTYGVKVMGFAGSQWFIYSPESVTITSYSAAADAADYAALNAAIDEAEGKDLGFEEGEYAPYNNIAAFAALATAKALDQSATNSKLLVQSTISAMDVWVANATEVNAICGGDFTQYETVGGQDLPYGWNLYNTGNNNSRIMGGTEGLSNAGLSAASSGKALLMKFNATYGETTGYTMPLKAGKIYKITFKYGGWNNAPATIVSLTDPSDAAITLAPNFRPATQDAHSDATHWYDYTGYFAATTDGDYKINFNKVESGQQQIVIADIDLRTANVLEFADGSVPIYAPGTYPTVKIARTLTANRWATAVYPFAVSGVDNIALLSSYDKDNGALGFSTAAASEANVPFLMKSTAGVSEISLSNVEVAAAAATDEVQSEASLKGVYSSTAITNEAKNYVLSNNTIYAVGTAGATIAPYRAYIQIAQDGPAARLSFFVDGEETTGIEGITVESQNAEALYNLNGQRVNASAKGIIVKNGKKFINK